MSFFPYADSHITTMKLHVSVGNETYEQTISSATQGANSVTITDIGLFAALQNADSYAIFTPYIETTYSGFPSGNNIITNPTSYYVKNKISTEVDVEEVPTTIYSNSNCLLFALTDSNSSEEPSITSSDSTILSVDADGNLIAGEPGNATVTITYPASSDGLYAATTQTLTITVTNSAYINLLPNNLTIRYIGPETNIPSDRPLFLQANPRGTGTEWFAVVNNNARTEITNYARTNSSSYFTPDGESTPVLFNNIVTTFITDMSNMFLNLSTFNHNISSFDTSRVTTMSEMFSGAAAFNQSIGSWCTGSVTNMSSMFSGAANFNNGQPAGGILPWNTSHVTNMSNMFAGAVYFNQFIGNWHTSRVINMSSMFNGAISFNQSIGNWVTCNVTNMSSMFQNAVAFNQPISQNGPFWNTSNVTNMSSMFVGAVSFNQPIGNWSTWSVNNMDFMFFNAIMFNQNLRSWFVSLPTPLSGFADGSALTQPNLPSFM